MHEREWGVGLGVGQKKKSAVESQEIKERGTLKKALTSKIIIETIHVTRSLLQRLLISLKPF